MIWDLNYDFNVEYPGKSPFAIHIISKSDTYVRSTLASTKIQSWTSLISESTLTGMGYRIGRHLMMPLIPFRSLKKFLFYSSVAKDVI